MVLIVRPDEHDATAYWCKRLLERVTQYGSEGLTLSDEMRAHVAAGKRRTDLIKIAVELERAFRL